jgi:Protein of unknown function (DUF2911)
MRPRHAALVGFLFPLCLAATVAGAQGTPPAAAARPAPPPLRIAASSFATVEVHLNARFADGQWYQEDAGLAGPSRIAIAYGQPHARGRKVEGGLVPIDTVSRFGANAATTLHTDANLTLGTLRIPRGDYTLFLLDGRAGWQLLVNRATGQWGTDRDSTLDLGRVPLAARALAEAEESLSVYLVPEAPRPQSGTANLAGTLRIKWGRTELTAPWTVVP